MASIENGKIDQINESKQEESICLVIMPFSDPKGYDEGHFRKVYEQILSPAIEKAGYVPYRIDENVGSTMIHGKLLEQLINAPMVLCDLSSKNPNVLYELGIRHAFDKPVVLVQEKGQDHIFDIAGLSTTSYRKERLYDVVLEDQDAIAEAVRQTAEAKKFSIMSLIRLTPATINQEKALSEDDRLEVILSDISERMRRIEGQVSDTTYSIGHIMENEIQRQRDSARRDFLLRVRNAQSVLSSIRKSESISFSSIMRTVEMLRNALAECERLSCVSEPSLNEARYVLVELENSIGNLPR